MMIEKFKQNYFENISNLNELDIRKLVFYVEDEDQEAHKHA